MDIKRFIKLCVQFRIWQAGTMAQGYILKVTPKLSDADAKKAEQQLNGRFNKVAKQYSEDMAKSNDKIAGNFTTKMKGAFSKIKVGWLAVAGVVASAITAITQSPINEADQMLNDILAKFDNISTRAQQWGVDAGRYWLLNQVGTATNVPEGGIDNMLMRIADRLDMARTGEDPTLSKYLGERDIIDVAYKLFQTWRQMPTIERNASMADILGARQANNYAELVNADWNQIAKSLMDGRTLKEFNQNIDKLGMLEGQQAINRARQANVELFRAGGSINETTIESQNRLELLKLNEALDDIARYSILAGAEIGRIKALAETVDVIQDKIIDIADNVAKLAGAEGKEEQQKAVQQIKTTVKRGAEGAVDTLTGSKSSNDKLEKIGLGGLW